MDAYTCHGVWFFPSEAKNRVLGTLEFDSDYGAEIEMFGSFEEFGSFEDSTYDVLWGETADGKDVTILNPYIYSTGGSFGTKSVERLAASSNSILVGGHFQTPIEFDSLIIDLPYLEQLSSINTVITEFDNEAEDPLSSMTTRVERTEPLECEIDETKIKFSITPKISNNRYKGVEYTQKAKILIASGMSLEDYQYYVHHLHEFFSLAVGEPIYPEELTGRIDRDDDLKDLEVNILRKYPHYTEPDESVHINKIAFDLNDIDFSTGLKNWFQHVSEVETLHELYFSTMYDSDMYVQYQFLALVISLESYYNKMYSTKRISDDEFKEVEDKIAEVLPTDSTVENRISGLVESLGNDYSLREKLERVMADHEDVLSPLIDDYEVARDATSTRHALAHGFNSDDRRVKSEIEELVDLTQALRITVETCLYTAIGVEKDAIRNQMKKKYRRAISAY